MIHQNQKLSVVLLLILAATQVQAQILCVKESIGTHTIYTLSDVKKLSFSSGNITVSKFSGSSYGYPLSDIRYLNFQDLTTNILNRSPDRKEAVVNIYPNPLTDFLNIRISNSSVEVQNVEILTFDGRILVTEKLRGQSEISTIPVSSLKKGIYLCRVTGRKTLHSFIIIKL